MSAEVTIDDVLEHLKIVTTEAGDATLSYNSSTSKIEVVAGPIQLPCYTIGVDGDTLNFYHEDPDAPHVSSIAGN